MTKIFTSIAPKNLTIQKKAVSSWLNLGFDVYSINNLAEENLYIRENFGTSVKCLRGSQPDNRYTSVLDILKYIFKTKETCWLINSDIILSAKQEDILCINTLADETVVFGNRTDICTMSSSQNVYKHGFDFFILNHKIDHLFTTAKHFHMGKPWWDYWLPITCIRKGITPIYYQKEIAIHYKHEQNWNKNDLYLYGQMIGQEVGIDVDTDNSIELLTEHFWNTINEQSQSYN